MNTSSSLLPAPARPTTEDRSWLAGDHSAEPVLALLGSLGWPMVNTPETNVHCTSPDGRVYVGWLPEDPGAWKHGIVWRSQVQPTSAAAWTQEFSVHTPSEAVTGFLATLIANPTR